MVMLPPFRVGYEVIAEGTRMAPVTLALYCDYLQVISWILHESEAFICKALKDEAIVCYCEPLITQQREASSLSASGGLARRVKIDEKKKIIIRYVS
jgi:hypothetical protein